MSRDANELCGRESSTFRDAFAVALVAVIIRLIGVALSQRTLPVVATDTSAWYLPIARSLAAGNGFQVAGSAAEAAHIPPLYPLWLSLFVRAAGENPAPWLIGVANALLRAIACAILFVIARKHFGRGAAFAAAALYIVDPWETFWVGYILKESLAVPLFLAAVLFLDRAAHTLSVRAFALAGAAIGIATLARFPSGALWIVAMGLIAIRLRPSSKQAGRRSAVLALAATSGMLAILSPWLIRNWRVVGQPVLSTHFVGRKLYTSNGPGVPEVRNGYYSPPGINVRLIDSLNPDGRSAMQQEEALASLTLKHLLAHPSEIPSRVAFKIVNMWQPTFEGSSRRNWVVLAVPYCMYMFLSLSGIWLAHARGVRATTIGVTLAVFFLVHLVFWGEIRNRQFLTPLLYCYAGFAVSALVDRVRGSTAAAVPARA